MIINLVFSLDRLNLNSMHRDFIVSIKNFSELKIKIKTKHWEFICTYYPNEIDGDAEDFFKQIFK